MDSLLSPQALVSLAAQVGTPFYLWSATTLRARFDLVATLVAAPGLSARYAMKACSTKRVLDEVRARGFWIDAVSGNEVLRAMRAGFPGGSAPPVVMLSADVFRDNALAVIRETGVLPNIGSPGQIDELAAAGLRGDIAMRLNPGFGHGHTKSCDTGGPSSKHGVWHAQAADLARRAENAGLRVVTLHAHVGTGPDPKEFDRNMDALVEFFARQLKRFPRAVAVNLGGGLPFSYRRETPQPDLAVYRRLLADAPGRLSSAAGREVRVEIEPGRYFVAPAAVVVARVTDVKFTETNAKGPGQGFIMVDAGFCDLVRPAMYGAYHHLSVCAAPGRSLGPEQMFCVAGPLCESGDLFTRDDRDMLLPRRLPEPRAGDFVVIHDAGAYGVSMSSTYNSVGRAPQVWLEADGSARLISRRETLDDLLRIEADEPL